MRHETDYPDLDALVLSEIESASGRRRRHQDDNGSVQPREGGPPAVARIHGDARLESGMSGEEAELLEQPSPAVSELDDLPPPTLFTPEEEAFMHRAVGFLSDRENGDMILGQIWERITQENPEAFYTAEDGSESVPDGGPLPGPENENAHQDDGQERQP